MAGKTLVVRRRTGFGGENPENPVVNELLSARLGVDDEIEVTTDHTDVITTAGAAGPATEPGKPQKGADPGYVEEELLVVTIFQADDPEAPKARKSRKRKPAKKSTAKKRTTAKKSTAKKRTAAKRSTSKSPAKKTAARNASQKKKADRSKRANVAAEKKEQKARETERQGVTPSPAGPLSAQRPTPGTAGKGTASTKAV